MDRSKMASSSRDDDVISMQELDPSPVDESPVHLSKSEYFGSSTTASQGAQPPLSSDNSSKRQPDNPAQSPPRRGFLSSLGLSGHGPIWWLTRVQRYSSYAFSAFLALHVTNTALIPLATGSVHASDNYLLLTRPYYQSPLLEPLVVLLPIAAHAWSGVALRLYRRRQSVRWYGAESRADRRRLAWPHLSGTSALGYALWPLLAAHVLVNRAVPLRLEGGSSGVGLSYVAHGFARHPLVANSVYAALLAAGAFHFVWGWAKWLDLRPATAAAADDHGHAADRPTAPDGGLVNKKRRWYEINGVAALVAGLWMAGGLGVVGRGGPSRGWIGRNFDALYRSIPIVGRWM